MKNPVRVDISKIVFLCVVMGEMYNVIIRGIVRPLRGVNEGARIERPAGQNVLVHLFSRGTYHSQLICLTQDIDEVCTK